MEQKRFEPVRLAVSGRYSAPWIYAIVGALGGAFFEILVCEPLDIVLAQVFNLFYGGHPFQLAEILQIFTRHQLPGITLTGLLYGGIIGYLWYRLKETSRRIEALHHEFELQVATLRHHYKNLAVGINGFSSRIKRKLSGLPECEALELDATILEEAAQKLTHTLGDELLFLKALTSESLVRQSQDFYPVLVHAAKDLQNLRFQEKEIKIEIDGHSLEEAHPALVFPFEPYTMQVILQNILSNAMKYGDLIQITIKENHNWVKVGVRDNGPGLDIDKIKKLLLPAAERRGESTHLGLQVSLHLLEKCGDRLSVWSEPGQGAEFIMEFPKSPTVSR